MAERTPIEWTQATWNPVTGCTRVSSGCLNCYIERTPPFRIAGRRFDGPGIGATTGVQLHPDRLTMPLAWQERLRFGRKAPRRVFVNSLSDVFHEDVPDTFVAHMFAAMTQAPEIVFQVLTKRPGRARSLSRSGPFRDLVRSTAYDLVQVHGGGYDHWWPLDNVHLLVSVEDQKTADLRIPVLLDTPAAVRGVSAEPLLGPVDLCAWLTGWNRAVAHSEANPRHILSSYDDDSQHVACYGYGCDFDSQRDRLDWVVVGGESGPGARPMHPGWARGLRDQCTTAGVPFFFKQWGEFAPARNGEAWQVGTEFWPIWRYGKKAAGRKLDGRTWDEMPKGTRP